MSEAEVVYALPEVQRRYPVRLVATATVREAIEACGVLQDFPGIDLARQRVGVFGRLVALDRAVSPGDRIEIYRPLAADPKDARRERAKGGREPAA